MLETRGLLADVNIQKHLSYLRISLDAQGLGQILSDHNIHLVTFRDLKLDPLLDDRTLWNYCQDERWVLFTDDRNNDGPDSLLATTNDSWHAGHLPILTPSRKRRLEVDRSYCDRVANDVAGLLIDIESGSFRDQPRIYVPTSLG